MQDHEAILFGRYYAGPNQPLKDLPISRRKIESQASFVNRRRIIAEIKLLDTIFGPVGPRSHVD